MNAVHLLKTCAAAVLLTVGGAAAAALTAIDQSGFLPSDALLDYGDPALYLAPADGLVVGQVTHGFTVNGSSSTQASVDITPGLLDFIELENVTGDAGGALSLTFATPQSRLGFGWALSLYDGSGSVTIELFDAGQISLGAVTIGGAPDSSFGMTTGFAGVRSDDAFVRAVMTWNDVSASDAFAFDNVRFANGDVSGVPEPGSLALLCAGFGFAMRLRRAGPRRHD